MKTLLQTPLYRKAFLIFFISLNIVFAFHLLHFMQGNHDWYPLLKGTKLGTHVANGRFSSMLNQELLGGIILPILSNIIAFASFSLSTLLLMHYWKVPKNLLSYTLIGLILVMQPNTLEALWYVGATMDWLMLPLYVILSYIISEYIAKLTFSIKSIFLFIISSAILVISLGMYNVVLNTIVIVFAGRFIIELIAWDGNTKTFIHILYRLRHTIASIVTACITYKGILIYLEYIGKIRKTYMTTSLALHDLPDRVLLIIEVVFGGAWNYAYPFIPPIISRIFLVLLSIVLCVFIYSLFRQHIRNKILKTFVVLFVLAITLILTQATGLFAENTSILAQSRIDLFSRPYLYALITSILLGYSQLTKNICFVGASIVIFICIIQSATALKVWKYGFEAERMVWERMMIRVENTDGFIMGKKYKILTLGTPAYRVNFFNPTYKYRQSPGTLVGAFDPNWFTFAGVEFYNYDFVSMRCAVDYSSNMKKESCLELVYSMEHEINNAAIWPAPSSVVVKDDIIMVVMRESALNIAQDLIRRTQ